MKQRIIYLDVVKCVAIFLVIWGHVIEFMGIQRDESIARVFIYSFHMPLFMLLSGYFSASSFSRTFKSFITKKSIQLLIPIFSWTVIISLFLLFVYKDKEGAIAEVIGGSWFLRTLFACYLYVYIVKNIKAPDWLLAFGSIIIAFFIPKSSFLSFNWLLMFFWVGYFLKKYQLFFDKYRLSITIVSLILYCIVFYNIKDCGYALININTLRTDSIGILIKFIGSLSASLFVINMIYYLCHFSNNGYIDKIADIGKYTLGIYLVQSFLVARLFPLLPQSNITNMYIYNFVLTPIVSVFVLLLSVLIIKYTSKNKYMNLFLFGNQY